MEIPDIVNVKHLRTFREWNSDLKKMPNIKMRKFCANDGVSDEVKKKLVVPPEEDLGELGSKDGSDDSDEDMPEVD